jgi:hypothetical protein
MVERFTQMGRLSLARLLAGVVEGSRKVRKRQVRAKARAKARARARAHGG